MVAIAARIFGTRGRSSSIVVRIPAIADDGDADRAHVLLMLQTLIGCHNDLKPAIDGRSQQDAVPEAMPALLTNGRNVMLGEERGELHRQ